jgi:hypothetical protein
MSTFISAPSPSNKVTIALPSAQLGDTTATEQDIALQETMTGVVYTYVKSNTRRKLVLTFRLTRMKSLELQAFLRIYYRAEWKVVLYDNTVWTCKLLNFPVQFKTFSRAGGQPGGEMVEVTLELSAKPV